MSPDCCCEKNLHRGLFFWGGLLLIRVGSEPPPPPQRFRKGLMRKEGSKTGIRLENAVFHHRRY